LILVSRSITRRHNFYNPIGRTQAAAVIELAAVAYHKNVGLYDGGDLLVAVTVTGGQAYVERSYEYLTGLLGETLANTDGVSSRPLISSTNSSNFHVR
jgi:hypothetical protein